MPSQQQLNPANFGFFQTPEPGCEGKRFIHVPLTYAQADFDSVTGINESVIDLSTITQGLPSPKMSSILGMIVRNPCAPATNGPFGGPVIQFDVKFNNGFKTFVPINTSDDQRNSYGGTFYIPVLATPPAQITLTAYVGLAFPFDPVTVDFYFTNYEVMPAAFPGIFVEIVS